MDRIANASLVASRYAYSRVVEAAELSDVRNLRYQAVFLMGSGGSGKTYASYRWMKFMPGGGAAGYTNRKEWGQKIKQKMTEEERSLSNLDFLAAKNRIESAGIKIEFLDAQSAKIPFRLYTYDANNKQVLVNPEDYSGLPPEVMASLSKVKPDIEKITEVVFGTPVHELPTYWRQVNPDLYKEELAGYVEKQPGYVHEMSSEMSKAYFEGVLETGDPVMVDGTGSNLKRMVGSIMKAQEAGYKTSVVYVYVPLTVSMIRNAVRTRKVSVAFLIEQFRAIGKNYAELRGMVDKAHFIDNRNESEDAKKYQENADQINGFVMESSGGRYQNLYELIKDVAPGELKSYGWLLKGEVGPSKSERQREIDRIRGERGISRKYASDRMYRETLLMAGIEPAVGEMFWY